tara:strand:- start:1739 stop:2464 length:726 start_codon:yes stop_codon:yes gene_type:complete
MALPSSGAISLSEIASQYGGTAPHSLKDYYRNGTEGVPDTVATASIPTSGEIGIKDFYGSSQSGNRDIRVWMSYLFNENGFGLNDQSSTDAPFSISASANAVAWQPVFRAGQGYITSASITISQNEDTSAYSNNVVLYGGTTDSNVTNIVAAWNAGSSGSTGGSRSYDIVWTTAGLISSITYTGGSYNTGIITWATDNVSTANSNGYTWFGFKVTNPPSFGKGARVLGGTFYSSSSVPQPT